MMPNLYMSLQHETYRTCTDVDSGVQWCATKVGEDGVMVDHFWGECDMATCTTDGEQIPTAL